MTKNERTIEKNMCNPEDIEGVVVEITDSLGETKEEDWTEESIKDTGIREMDRDKLLESLQSMVEYYSKKNKWSKVFINGEKVARGQPEQV